MPFDDSNIRKLVRYQLEKKIHFSRYKPLSIECKQLILSLLEPDIKLRLTMIQMKNHDWIKGRITPVNQQDLIGKSLTKSFTSTVNTLQESTVKMMKTTIHENDPLEIVHGKISFGHESMSKD